MAKISARGDSALAKWRKPNGGLICLTEQGRVLTQTLQGDGYRLYGRVKKVSGIEAIELVDRKVAKPREAVKI